MATILQFEDLEAWQMARQLTRRIYALSRHGTFATDRALRDQIRRASISVMSNIAEGFDRGSTKAFIQFLSYARASASEVKSQLYIALDESYITAEQFEEACDITAQTVRLTSGLIKYLQKTKLKGSKFQ
jgi:four helix bundle protein